MSFGQAARQLLDRMNAAERRLARQDGLSAGWQCGIFVLVFLLFMTRSPDLFLHPQFYAEDGAIWYADAYNSGWLHSLAWPDGGYLNTLQRLGAGVSLLFPFALAPLVMNCFGLLVQCVPVTVLLSARTRNWAPLTTRALMAAVFVAIPNAREIHVVLTNSQWHLALAVPLLLFAEPPRSWVGRVVDAILLLVAGFSGPFCVILLPLAAVFWWVRRQGWTLAQIGIMLLGSAVQLSILLTHPAIRNLGRLGAKPSLFFRMLGGNTFAAAMFGSFPFGVLAPYKLILLACVGGVSLYLYCLWRAPLPLKLFVVYCLLLLPPALHAPLIAGPKPLWELLAATHSSRYWFFPMMAFVWCAVWCSQHARARFFRFAGTAVFLAMSVGIVQDWRYRPLPDEDFPASVRRFEAAKPGERVAMRIPRWESPMVLIKKP